MSKRRKLKRRLPENILGVFSTRIVKNTGIALLFQQFYALLLKRIINSKRNYLVLIGALLPFIFVVISLIIDQRAPKPEDSPPLIISFDRYRKTNVPYTYDRNEEIATKFIRSYESILGQSPNLAGLFDLTTSTSRTCQDGKPTDVISYLMCIGQRSLLELNDQYLIGVNVNVNSTDGVSNLTGYFNNQPYHAPPLSVNYISNALLRQYSPTSPNRSIHVVNHPVDID